MTFLPRFLLASLLGGLLAGPARADWLPTDGPGGKSVVGLAADGTDLLALAADGLYRSRNRGDSWQRIPAATGSGLLTSLAVRGGEAYIGTYGGVFRRASESSAWAPAAALEDTTVQALAFAGSAILAGTGRLGHLYRSTDGGATWSRLNPEVRMGAMLHLAADGPRLYAATSEGAFLSSDDGATWSRSLPDASDYVVRTLAWNGRYLFARTSSHVYRSSDKGAKWSRITPPDLPTAYPDLKSFAFIGSRVYATSLRLGLLRSEDHGDSWTRDTSFFHFTITGSNYLFATLGDDLFAGGARGIYRSRDQGLAWASANTGFGGTGVYHLTGLGPGRILAANNGGYFRTEDNGRHWTHCPPAKRTGPEAARSLRCRPRNPSVTGVQVSPSRAWRPSVVAA